ncbi:MAG: hypothetical protein ACPGGG_03355 [Parvibaculales bacterium]
MLNLRFIAALLLAGFIFSPLAGNAAELPKCRNVAGYEPKPTCQARNQRAQWQAEQTARLTAQMVVALQAEQAANKPDDSLTGQVKGFIDSAIETVRGLF